MPKMHRFVLLNMICGLLIGSAVALPVAASTACMDLPQSTLQLYSIEAVDVQKLDATKNGLRQQFPSDFVSIRHPVMLVVSNVVALYDIKNRVIQADDGSICGSPELVRIGFGSTQRTIFLAQPAADDDCVRRRILDHGEVHIQALDDAVLRFIDEQQATFQQGMKALKQTPAPSESVLEEQWDRGLQIIISISRQQLITKMRAASAQVDEGSILADLANACGGKIGRFDQDLEMNP